jgi:hypothetical protein
MTDGGGVLSACATELASTAATIPTSTPKHRIPSPQEQGPDAGPIAQTIKPERHCPNYVVVGAGVTRERRAGRNEASTMPAAIIPIPTA